jgi:hypothetical protein
MFLQPRIGILSSTFESVSDQKTELRILQYLQHCNKPISNAPVLTACNVKIAVKKETLGNKNMGKN